MPTLTSFDSRQLRNVLGTFTTGVTVVTTRDADGIRHGVTANSFSSVSLEPPLVLWSQALTSRSLPAFQASGHFAVNVLAEDQIEISKHFARAHEDKFVGISYTDGLGGVPVLEGTVAHFECVKVAEYPAGDHVIYLGRVERVSHSGRRPLAFSHGRYMVPVSHEIAISAVHIGGVIVASVEAVRIVADALPDVQTKLGGRTISLAVWGNKGPTIIRWERGVDDEESALPTGVVLDISRSAAGRAFTAFLPPEATRAFVEEDLRRSRIAHEEESTQRTRFDEAIETTRRSGIARSTEGEPLALSVPVYDREGNMILAISVSSSATAELELKLAAAGENLSRLIADADSKAV